jgi:hypothetical protein
MLKNVAGNSIFAPKCWKYTFQGACNLFLPHRYSFEIQTLTQFDRF